MKKYEVQKLIESGTIDLSKLSAKDKEIMDDMLLITDNWKEDDKDARDIDETFANHLKSTEAYKKSKPSAAKEKKPSYTAVDLRKLKTINQTEAAIKKIEEALNSDAGKVASIKKEWESDLDKLKSHLNSLKQKDSKEPKESDPKAIDKALDAFVGKTMYFKGDKGNWIKAQIHNVLPISKQMERWVIEFYPSGGKEELKFPLVSDQLTTDQIQKFMDGEVVKTYTITKPSEKIISDFEQASKEIDRCIEKSKTERIEKIIQDGPPVKKTTFTEFKDNTRTYANHMARISKVEKPNNPEVLKKINKVVETAQMQIKDLLFGDGKKTDQIQKIIDEAFGKK